MSKTVKNDTESELSDSEYSDEVKNVENVEEVEDEEVEDVDVDIEEEDDENEEDEDDDNENSDDSAYNVARKSKNKMSVIEKDNEYDNNNTIKTNNDLYNFVPTNMRKSLPVLSKYERARLLGERTTQLANGAKPMIKGVNGLNSQLIAELELEAKMIPIKIIRPMDDGTREQWKLSELKLKNKYIKYGFGEKPIDKKIINSINSEIKRGGSIVGYSHLVNEMHKKN